MKALSAPVLQFNIFALQFPGVLSLIYINLDS